MANPMALLEQFFDQRGWFTGALKPDNLFARTDDCAEVEIFELNFVRHSRDTRPRPVEESHNRLVRRQNRRGAIERKLFTLTKDPGEPSAAARD